MDNIKFFKLENLYNKYTVNIKFDEGKRIIVSENGMGKTTILKAFNYCITRNKDALRKIDFTKISITFEDDEQVNIYRNALRLSNDIRKKYFKENIIIEEFNRNLKLKEKKLNSSQEELNFFNQNSKLKEKEFQETERAFKVLEKRIDVNKVLYLPTYRRIEENLEEDEVSKYISLNPRYISFDDIKRDIKNNIHYGVEDVKKRFQIIKESISKLSMDAMNNISKDFFNDFLNDGLEPKINKEFNTNQCEKFINRINTLSKSEKKEINNKLKNDENISRVFIYFIERLQSNYKTIEKKEKAIQNFIDVCNQYFKPRKEILYDNLNARIYIKDNEISTEKKTEEIELEDLSSGEKQIIGLFSKIYLEDIDEYYVIFDEPELSLSIEWQEKLLPNIIDSNKCKLLFVATHSPFIFENECEKYTESLNVYLEECDK